MKHIDEYYKDWCGESHLSNSCHPVHDSTEACDFAEYYHTERLRCKNASITFIILQRILAFPFFFGIALVGVIIMFTKWMVNFVRFGGESIAYTEKTQRKSILDVFMKLKTMQK